MGLSSTRSRLRHDFIAAEQTGRRARGIEIDPGYVDVAIKRWQRFAGKSALLAGTDQTFKEVEEQRAHAGRRKPRPISSNAGRPGGRVMTLPNEHEPDATGGNAIRVIMWSVSIGRRSTPGGSPANPAIPVVAPKGGSM